MRCHISEGVCIAYFTPWPGEIGSNSWEVRGGGSGFERKRKRRVKGGREGVEELNCKTGTISKRTVKFRSFACRVYTAAPLAYPTWSLKLPTQQLSRKLTERFIVYRGRWEVGRWLTSMQYGGTESRNTRRLIFSVHTSGFRTRRWGYITSVYAKNVSGNMWYRPVSVTVLVIWKIIKILIRIE